MNSGDSSDLVAEETPPVKKPTDLAISATIDTIVEVVSYDQKVALVGFGTFERRARSARAGRKPKARQKNHSSNDGSTSLLGG
jgi:DNA-binding protein HU-beta